MSTSGVYLRHYPQPHPWGCMYYSYAAFTEDEEIFEHVEDCNVPRFVFRLYDRGYYLRVIFSNEYATAPREWWQAFAADYVQHYPAWPLLLAVPSLKYEGVKHSVAVMADLEGDYFEVADPGAERLQVFDFEEFLDSPYADAFEVAVFQPNNPDVYPEDHGPSLSREFQSRKPDEVPA